MRTPFLGSAYRSRSPNLADQQLINYYLEIVETKSGKEPGAFFNTPGLTLLCNVADGPIRALRAFNGFLYAVAGYGVWRIDTGYNVTGLGNIVADDNPASLTNNDTQLGIASAGHLYTVVANALAEVSLPFSACGTLSYQDGLVITFEPGTNVIWQSNFNDLTTWDALNFQPADGQPGNIVGLANLHRQQVIMKQAFTEFWVNEGNNGFVFGRLDGVYPAIGVVATYSPANLGEEIAWLGASVEGVGIAYAMSGYEPRRISTHALEQRWATYTTIADAIGFSYQQEGHLFYVLTFPSGNETWVYDATASAMSGHAEWHQRGYFSAGAFSRILPQAVALFNGQVIVGDRTTGNIYAWDLNVLTDNSAAIKRVRSWRAGWPQDELSSRRFSCLEIDVETGADVEAGANPQFMFQYSDDGGHTWSTEQYAAAGMTGQYKRRVRFRRLGMKRRGLSSDRIFMLSTTDQFKGSLLGASLK